MMRTIEGIALIFAGLVFLGTAAYAQQGHEQHSAPATAPAAAAPAEEEHIFCPTMKTGQLCAHGTAANLRLGADKNEQWVTIARKYSKAVNTATEDLFKDAEAILNPEQMALLKSWFAVGLN